MIHRKIRKGSPQRNVPNEGGLGFSAIFDQYVVISRKPCILDTKLLWGGNRKPYASYRMMTLSMTLSNPWPGFQGHGSFKRRVSPTPLLLHKPCKLFASVAGFVSDSWASLFQLAASHHLGFGPTGSRSIQSAELENPTQNQTWSGSDDPLLRYGRSKFYKMRGRSVVGPQYIHYSHVLLFATLGT